MLIKYHLLSLLAILSSLSSTSTAQNHTYPYSDQCVTNTPGINDTSMPRNFGIVVFRGFEPIDVWGPIEIWGTLARNYKLNLSIIAETLDPVSTRPHNESMNPKGSEFFVAINPTHTFATAPRNLDVLMIPGGAGTRNPNMTSTLDFIKEQFPRVPWFLTVCTGAMLAAKAGVLDGRNATTNKAAWRTVVPTGPKTNWIPKARWVVDGKVWSSAGVSAGTDLAVAFTACRFGDAVAQNVSNNAEWMRNADMDNDPFAEVFGVPGA